MTSIKINFLILEITMVGETRDRFFACNNIPGHSRCERKIEKGNCPSCKGGVSDSCEGRHKNKKANLQQALQWIHATRTTKQTQAVGFV